MKVSVIEQIFQNLSVTQLLVACLLVLALIYYLYATRHHGIWEKLGVPGPKPWPIIDHQIDLRHGFEPTLSKWFQQYGSTFGTYGLLPQQIVLVTKDVNLLKQVLVKDFQNFQDRTRPRKTYSSLKDGISTAKGDKWRRIRHVTSPLFTGSKLKTILAHVCDSAETLLCLSKEKVKKRELLPIKSFASKFSTEVIARVVFGIQAHEVSEMETEFEYWSRNLINDFSKFVIAVTAVYQYFPPIYSILRFFGFDVDFINKNADYHFRSLLQSTMKSRREGNNSEKVRDLLDMLMKVEVKNDDPRLCGANAKILSHDEVIGNSTVMILAGVETVSVALQSLLYSLALYPDIQEKVVAEIVQVFPEGSKVEYELLKNLKYTEQVLCEGLRLYPLLSTIVRRAAETKSYGSIKIPKGAYVLIPLGAIMKDPEYWPDPEKFDPERFSPENKATRDPLTFMPFGYGPRICLGMRLAMMELKVILVYLLRDLRFFLSDRTEPKKGEKLEMKKVGIVAVRPNKPITLDVTLRKSPAAC